MDHALTRRGLLAGMGVAAGAAALGTGIGPAGAASPGPSLAFGPTGLDPAALVAGLSYIVIDGSAFIPGVSSTGWDLNVTNQGVELNNGGALVAPSSSPSAPS